MLQEALKLNNEGVLFLSAGDYGSARSHFQKALVILLEQHTTTSETEEELHLVPRPGIRLVDASSHELPNLKASPFHLFCNPVSLPVTEKEHNDSNNNEDCLLVYTAIVLLNSALLFHERRLSKALSLYGKCLELLKVDECWSPITQAIAIIVLNNKAEMHFSHGDQYEEARECMSELTALLLSSDSVVVNNNDGQTDLLLTPELCGQIVTNTLTHRLCSSGKNAPAA